MKLFKFLMNADMDNIGKDDLVNENTSRGLHQISIHHFLLSSLPPFITSSFHHFLLSSVPPFFPSDIDTPICNKFKPQNVCPQAWREAKSLRYLRIVNPHLLAQIANQSACYQPLVNFWKK
jgi:hypothetical protein